MTVNLSTCKTICPGTDQLTFKDSKGIRATFTLDLNLRTLRFQVGDYDLFSAWNETRDDFIETLIYHAPDIDFVIEKFTWKSPTADDLELFKKWYPTFIQALNQWRLAGKALAANLDVKQYSTPAPAGWAVAETSVENSDLMKSVKQWSAELGLNWRDAMASYYPETRLFSKRDANAILSTWNGIDIVEDNDPWFKMQMSFDVSVRIPHQFRMALMEQCGFSEKDANDNQKVAEAILYAKFNPKLPYHNDHEDQFFDGVGNMRGLIKVNEILFE